MTVKPLFSDRLVTKLRAVQIRGWLNMAVGGDTWTVTRWTGDGVSTARTQTTVGAITGYIYEEKAVQLVSSSGGVQVGQAGWRLALISGTVQVEDVLISVADSRAFTVRALDVDFLFSRATVEKAS